MVTLASGTVLTQSYTAGGQRAAYTVTVPGQPAQSVSMRFSYRGNGELGQAVVVSGTMSYTDTYIYQPNGLPLELLRVTAPSTMPLRYFYVVDGRHNVVALTSLTGTVVDRYAYDLWGVPTSTSETVPQPLRYGGYWFDQQLGWYWVSVRHYDPTLKRWLQPDPSQQDGMRTYVYVGDNPLDATDPTGLACTGIFVTCGGGNCSGSFVSCNGGDCSGAFTTCNGGYCSGSFQSCNSGYCSGAFTTCNGGYCSGGFASCDKGDCAGAFVSCNSGDCVGFFISCDGGGPKLRAGGVWQDRGGVHRFSNTRQDRPDAVAPTVRLVQQGEKWVTAGPGGATGTASGLYEFVTLNGTIFAQKVSRGFGHIGIAANQSVDYAGLIQFSSSPSHRGTLKWWSNGSGHYKPLRSRAWQAGLPLNKFEPDPESPLR